MTSSTDHEVELRNLLHRCSKGDTAALDDLLRFQYHRLIMMTRRMLKEYRNVKRWCETDDVFQNAMVRLFRALADVKPESPREFLGLASLQIRRELIDLARHYYGPMGIGANYDSQMTQDPENRIVLDKSDHSHEPSTLAQWTELHQKIDQLPKDEREVVNLLFYQGLPQTTAAELMQTSLRTLQRRWHNALVKLHRVWDSENC